MTHPRLLRNPVTGDLVILAEDRAHRPLTWRSQRQSLADGDCPFCAGGEDQTPPAIAVYPRVGDWQVRVVPNKYPAVSLDLQIDGSERRGTAVGVHEVIIETPRHVASYSELTDDEIQLVFQCYRDRIAAGYRQGSEFVQLFKNARADAGASLVHCHSQLLGISTVPPRAQRQMERLSQSTDCPLCHWNTLADADAVLERTDDWVVLCPRASRFAYQSWFVPTRHIGNFADCGKEAISQLGRLVRQVTQRFEQQLDNPAYNFVLHSFPPTCNGLHFYVELFPRTAVPGGFEWGSEAFINTVSANEAARMLRGCERRL